MTNHDHIPVASETAAPSEPLTFTVALRRNRFFRDEEGQAMVEFAVVGPFLLFLMMSIYHFFALLDAKQDFYIHQRSLTFGTIVGSAIGGDKGPGDPIGTRNTSMNLQGKDYTVSGKRSDMGFGTGAWLGADIIDIPNVVRFYPAVKIAFGGEVKNAMNGIFAGFQVNRPGRDTFSHITQFTGSPDMSSFSNILDLLGTPYQAMGLDCMDYYSPDETIAGISGIAAREIDNPYRDVLLGLGSTFLGMAQGDNASTEGGFALDPIQLAAKFPLVVDSWKADFVNGVRATELQTEWFIQERAGGLSFFNGPYGWITKLGMLLTSLNIGTFGLSDGVMLREWDNLPYDNRELGNAIFSAITLIDPFQWNEHFKYKVERRDGASGAAGSTNPSMSANEIPWRSMKALNGQNLVESWK